MRNLWIRSLIKMDFITLCSCMRICGNSRAIFPGSLKGSRPDYTGPVLLTCGILLPRSIASVLRTTAVSLWNVLAPEEMMNGCCSFCIALHAAKVSKHVGVSSLPIVPIVYLRYLSLSCTDLGQTLFEIFVTKHVFGEPCF